MSDRRTDAQRSADVLLDKAFAAQAEAYQEEGGKAGIVTASIGVYALTWYDDIGPRTAIGIATPSGDTLPYHIAMGLFDYAQTLYRAEVLVEDDEL